MELSSEASLTRSIIRLDLFISGQVEEWLIDMSILTRLYRIHLRESERERRYYLDLLSQASGPVDRQRAQHELELHDARIRGIKKMLGSD